GGRAHAPPPHQHRDLPRVPRQRLHRRRRRALRLEAGRLLHRPALDDPPARQYFARARDPLLDERPAADGGAGLLQGRGGLTINYPRTLVKFASSLLTRASRLTPRACRFTPPPCVLLAWVLLALQSGAPNNISFADKLRTWVEAAEADTQAACEEQREQLKLSSAIGRALDAVERFNQGICVERAKVDAARK